MEVGELDRITCRASGRSGRPAKALNPMARDDVQLFHAVMSGDHCVRGFDNRAIRAHLEDTPHLRALRGDERRQGAKVTRILHRLHAHGLIARIPRSRRWRTTDLGRRVMATALQVRELNFPQLLALAA